MSFYGETTAKELKETFVGRVLTDVWVGPGEHDLVFGVTQKLDPLDSTTKIFAKDLILLQTNGDCCSESWWADIYNLDQSLGEYINDFKSIPWADDPDDGRTRQEVDSVYGYELTTKRGVTDFVFRNSSNGYYGGWADVFLNPAGLSFEGLDTDSGWKKITTSDWSS